MSLYESLRFRGIVKKEYREIFEPIALEGKWEESSVPGLRDFGDYPQAYCFPMSIPSMVGRWEKDPWKTSYNKTTGEWLLKQKLMPGRFPSMTFFGTLFIFIWNLLHI